MSRMGRAPYNSWYRNTQSRQDSTKAEAAQMLQYIQKKLKKFVTMEDPVLRKELQRYQLITAEVLATLKASPPTGVSPDNKIQASEWAQGSRPKSPRSLPPLTGPHSSPRSGRALRGAPSPIPEVPDEQEEEEVDHDLSVNDFGEEIVLEYCPATMGERCLPNGQGFCKTCERSLQPKTGQSDSNSNAVAGDDDDRGDSTIDGAPTTPSCPATLGLPCQPGNEGVCTMCGTKTTPTPSSQSDEQESTLDLNVNEDGTISIEWK